MSLAKPKTTGAENVYWDLSTLYKTIDAPEIEQDLAAIRADAEAFSNQYRGKIASLSAKELREATERFEDIAERITKLYVYALLTWATDTLDDSRGRFLSNMEQAYTAIEQELMFFELEWKNAPEATAKLADDPALERYEHYLKISRLTAPFTLSEPEERVITELNMSGASGWTRYFGEVMSNARYEMDGKKLNQSEVLAYMHSPDRDARLRAATALTEGLKDLLHTTTYVFNMLAVNKKSIDKMRDYPTWITSRNLSNQVQDDTVEALIEAVTGRYDIVARHYRLVRKLLNYDELYDYDRYAPVLDEQVTYSWNEARDVVLGAYSRFDSRMADIASEFFEKQWIDAALAPNKRGGAFSHGVVPSANPFILMNFTGDQRSVMTLAHELGHGIHQYLSRQKGFLQSDTPLTTAEMASTFGEMLVFTELMSDIDDPKVRLATRLDKISDTFATVFRQVAMNRFEHAMHTTLRAEGHLSSDHLSAMWMETQRAMFEDSLTLRDDYQYWWSYIPHFLGSPGYVYAYAFGELLVWALYARYQQESSGFADRYITALSQGGSLWPHDMLAPLGVNLQDPAFWHEGLNLIEDMVAQAEQEADKL